jgi:hypothetical protein
MIIRRNLKRSKGRNSIEMQSSKEIRNSLRKRNKKLYGGWKKLKLNHHFINKI